MKNDNVVHLFISGKVQGVGFRYNTKKKARELGISGWVRNLEDGRVEVLASGEEPAIAEFLQFCEQGPPAAWVRSVEQTEADEEVQETGFTVRHSK